MDENHKRVRLLKGKGKGKGKLQSVQASTEKVVETQRQSSPMSQAKISSNSQIITLEIKNLQKRVGLSSDEMKLMFIEFKGMLRWLLSEKPGPSISNQKFHKLVKYLVNSGNGKMMYDTVLEDLDKHLLSLKQSLDRKGLDGVQFLVMLMEKFTTFESILARLTDLLAYMDKQFTLERVNWAGVKRYGVERFVQVILYGEQFVTYILNSVSEYIGLERKDQAPNIANLSSVFSLTKALPQFHPRLETMLITQLQELYTAKFDNLRSDPNLNLGKHVQLCLDAAEGECQGLRFWLDGFGIDPDRVQHAIYQILLSSDVSKAILEGELKETLKLVLTAEGSAEIEVAEGIEALGKTFQLFQTCKQLPDFVKKVEVSMQYASTAYFTDLSSNPELLERLLAYDLKYQHLFHHAFQAHEPLKQVFDKGVRNVLQTSSDHLPKLLARKFDHLLQSPPNATFPGYRIDSLDQQELVLEQVLKDLFRVFRFLRGRDMFEGFYKAALAKRLLLGRVHYERLERVLLVELKKVVGGEYTETLEKMFFDLEFSTELAHKFPNWVHKSQPGHHLPFQFEPKVLTTAMWPTYPIEPFEVPQEMSDTVDLFNRMYGESYKDRKLFWNHTQSKCTLKATFLNRSYELTVSLAQALVLLQFQDDLTEIPNKSGEGSAADPPPRLTLSFQQLEKATKLSAHLLRLTLVSLLRAPRDLLIKVAREGDKIVSVEDSFQVNAHFKSKTSKIYVNTIQLKETKMEDDALHHLVIENRKNLIDAFLVRTLKSLQSARTTQILELAFAQLHFPTDPKSIKHQISSLIEREFLVRDEEDIELVHYVA